MTEVVFLAVLGLPCPFCGGLYAEHSLESLARCTEETMEET